MTSIEERSILCYVYITEDCVAIKIMLKNNYFHEKKKLSKKKKKIVVLMLQGIIRIRVQKSLTLEDNQYKNNT